MKTKFSWLVPVLLRFALVLACLGFCAGCGSDKDEEEAPPVPVPDAFHEDPNLPSSTNTTTTVRTNAPPSTTPSDPLEKVNLTGNWKRLTAVYKLKHTGASLQGVFVDGVSTNISGKIAGSVDGIYVEMDIIVHYEDNPTNDFTAHKTGKITGKNSMRLVVTSSPHAQGQVQDWYR